MAAICCPRTACFLGALLIMASYPLTEARFKEIVRDIQATRARRLAPRGTDGAIP